MITLLISKNGLAFLGGVTTTDEFFIYSGIIHGSYYVTVYKNTVVYILNLKRSLLAYIWSSKNKIIFTHGLPVIPHVKNTK